MSTYLRILRTPHVAPLLGWMLLARLPIGINALAAVLFLRAETGSFAVAGAAAGALALGAALGAPIGARLTDAFGRGVLLGLAGAHAAGLIALLAVGSAPAPDAAIVAAALVAGLALPPTSSVMRSLYPRLFARDAALVQGAYALDSVLTETIFVVGPLLTGALMVLLEPGAALVLSAAAVCVGVSAFLVTLRSLGSAGARRPRGPAPREGGRLGALRAPGIRTLVLSMLPVGFALGALEVGLPAFADQHGKPEAAGLLIALWSLASAAGGFVYGARVRRSPLGDVHVRVALLVPLGFVPLLLGGPLWAMALLTIPAGIMIAPLIASRNELAGVVAPSGAETEAFAWPLTALVSGVSLGAAAGGSLVEAGGWRSAALAAVLAASLGAAVALARRATLEARRPEPAIS